MWNFINAQFSKNDVSASLIKTSVTLHRVKMIVEIKKKKKISETAFHDFWIMAEVERVCGESQSFFRTFNPRS